MTLTNIGAAHYTLGDLSQALTCYEQALAIQRTTGDQDSESVTLFNMAMIYRDQNRLAEAEQALAQVVALDETLEAPDLDRDRAVLEQVRTALQAQASGTRAEHHRWDNRPKAKPQ